MAWSGKCMTLVVLIACSSVCQSSRPSRSSIDINYLPPVYYPGSSTVGSFKGIYEECSASYDDPDGDCIVGTAGRDYPVHSAIHSTGFSCRDFPSPGYYADVSTGCQVFHICSAGGRKHSTLCPNGTIFNQEVMVCDWWYNVDCASSNYFYGVNDYVHEASKEATRSYHEYPPKAHEYGKNFRQESYRNVQTYSPAKTPDFSHPNYDNNNYAHVHGPSRTPDYSSVHGPSRTPDYSSVHGPSRTPDYSSVHGPSRTPDYSSGHDSSRTPDFSHQNYDNDNNDNNNYAPGHGPSRTPDYTSAHSPSGTPDYVSVHSPSRTHDYVSIHSPSGTSDYDHPLRNQQHFARTPTGSQVYDTPRDFVTPVKTVPRYIIKNVGIGEQIIPQYANTPVYNEAYYEAPEVQQYDSASYASTIKPSYKKKTTRSNDKSKASKATKGKN